MLKLTSAQRSLLRSQAHSLNPVVMIGDAGLSDAVLKEINVNLDAHSLIKTAFSVMTGWHASKYCNRSASNSMLLPLQHIGKLLVIYRPQK